jgi:hypothetical protein
MDEGRARQVGLNEAVFREINENVDAINRSLADLTDNRMHIVCECGELSCIERLVVPLEIYETVRADSTRFFVKPGHDKPNYEDVVEHTDAFDIVQKRPGVPEQVAEATDPRS